MSGWLQFDNNKGISCDDSKGIERTVIFIKDTGNMNIGNTSISGDVYINCNSNYGIYRWDNTTAYRILDSGNYANYALPKSGGTVTGSININNQIHLFASDGTLRPGSDNSGYLGTGSYAWTSLYAYNVNNLSDERLKTDISEIDGEEAAAFIQTLHPIRYRWKQDDGKVHTGFSVQKVEDATSSFQDLMFGGVVHEEVEGGDDRYALAYNEFHASEVAAIKYILNKLQMVEQVVYTTK